MLADLDLTTLSLSHPPPTADNSAPASVPALTILWHPDLSRVGAMFSLADLPTGTSVPISRTFPTFSLQADESGPLSDPFLSRKNPVVEITATATGVTITPKLKGFPITVNGQVADGKHTLPKELLDCGIILTLGDRIALCIHQSSPARPFAEPDLGILGHSGAISDLRRSIRQVAKSDFNVLILGESGTGKELTAKAIVESSSRAKRRYVKLNMGSMQPSPSVAATELFGSVKGGFTDAENRKGCFVEADQGTLFLDEIAKTPAEVQSALLRTLETGEVRPVGDTNVRKTFVRVLSATDDDLARLVTTRQFLGPLYHRLASLVLRVPPLRERREDIGLLFLRFLREALAGTGALPKLQTPPTSRHLWVTAGVIARMALARWPGNVRQLRNFARQFAVSNQDAPQARLSPALLSLLDESDTASPVGPDGGAPEAPSGSRLITHARLRQALEDHDFEIAPAARALGRSRATIYKLIQSHPDLLQASKLSSEELRGLLVKHRGDVASLAEHLRISVRALKRRLRQS
jgi:two-component system, NtrC family, nitrogen regulation response regulator GlnG